MNLYAVDFRLTDAIERRVKRGVGAAVGRLLDSVTAAVVRLRDVNGPRGGIDKACRIVVRLRGRGTSVAEAVDRDLYAAIDAAAAKLGRSVRRRSRRRRTLRREHALRRVSRAGAAPRPIPA
jgi:ribosome-associated translation inhibitor RaiA